jgi:hypothetical protein
LQELNKIIRFLIYTNTNLGFTIKYPSDWATDEGGIVSGQTVRFTSADGVGNVVVGIENASPELRGISNMNDLANFITSHLSTGPKLLEIDSNR